MSLITDKKTTTKLETRLNEFREYGMTIYYLFEDGRTNIKDLENLFFSKDDEKSNFTYGKIMKHIKPSDLNKSFEKYKDNYPNDNDDNENEYKKNLNTIYTNKIIDLLIKEKEDRIDKTYINTYKHLLTKIDK
jgi:hypothetical protein